MSDLPPDLPRLRVLEAWLLCTLQRVRQEMESLERREVERRRGEQARPPDPDWVLELGIGDRGRPVYVHVGGCHMIGKHHRGIGRDEALRALADGVDGCPHCRPDSDLGMLE